MKIRFDKMLPMLFWGSLLLYVVLVLLWTGILENELPISLLAKLGVSFLAAPFFFLQLILCRKFSRKWVKGFPLFVLMAVILICITEYFCSSGWDSLGWMIILVLCIAPALGCVLAIFTNLIWKYFTQRNPEAEKR